eukprot:571034-Amphidinium_carterae.1
MKLPNARHLKRRSPVLAPAAKTFPRPHYGYLCQGFPGVQKPVSPGQMRRKVDNAVLLVARRTF